MKRGDVIYQEKKTIKTAVIELETILPIDSIRLQPALPTGSILVESSLNTKDFYPLDYERMDHDEYTELKLHNQRAHILRLTADRTDDVEITVRVGSGYYAVRNEAFTSLFERKAGWVGSDGIYRSILLDRMFTMKTNRRRSFVSAIPFSVQSMEGRKNALAPI